MEPSLILELATRFGPAGLIIGWLVWERMTTARERLAYDRERLEADRQLADGRLLAADHARFVQRANDAATAGIGHGGRPWTDLPEHPPAPLLPYR